ncbi:HEAT repeat domain-containing protein [Nocardia sp. NPDC023852]|uniref:HEAT repeat domain-containing protein n=1 Tax=Nocardia sp. NPDC023852 TaxID=3154697 RepID=UPI0033E8BB52
MSRSEGVYGAHRIRESLNSSEWDVRRAAARALGTLLPDSDALSDLTALLRDEDIAVQQEAAESLSRYGGRTGLAIVLTELGLRAEDADADADYIAYRLRELQIFEQLPILRTARDMTAELTADARAGLDQLEELFGTHFPA